MTETTPTPVRLETADGLAIITLSRPDVGNAMDMALIDGFATAATQATADPGLRAVLIRAEGRNFCVGGDIKAMAGETVAADFIGRLARRLHEGIARLAAHSAPVIVAVQGAAAGAGLSLVAGGDVVLAGASAKFAVAYPAIGLTADGGATWLLPRVIGLRRTQEMMYTGRRLNAEEAERYGLVTRVVEDEALAEDALALARTMAQGPTGAFGGVKRLLLAGATAPFTEHLDAEADSIAAAMAAADAAEGVAAFLARRPPVFSGR